MKNRSLILFTIFLLCIAIKSYSQHDLYGVWARKSGVASSESAINVTGMLTDKNNNLYVYGTYYGTVSLSDNTCNLINSVGYPYTGEYINYIGTNGVSYTGVSLRYDGFINKYNSKGEWQWTVRVASEVYDAVNGIALSDDDESLIFLAIYGNHSYSPTTRPTANSCKIFFGDNNEKTLEYNLPRNTFYNAMLGKVNTKDGSEVFTNYLGYGSDTPTDPMYRFACNSLYGDSNGYIYVFGEVGTPHDQFTYKYDASGNVVDYLRHPDQSGYDISLSRPSRNLNTSHFYSRMVWGTGEGDYNYGIFKINTNDLSRQNLSHVSKGIYGVATIGVNSIDVNDSETHLFVTGGIHSAFTYVSSNTPMPYAGGTDGIIICYDPQNLDEKTNIRWMANLSSSGDEVIYDCKFDENTQTLRVVGYVGTTPVNFNPLGTPMNFKATNNLSIFYAVYDMNGICQHVEIIESDLGQEIGQALNVVGDDVSIFGTFTGSPFQADPSGRLEPLRTTESSAFLANYSTNPLSQAEPLGAGSYSAANNLIATYGLAFSDAMPCLSLGTKNDAVPNNVAWTYVPNGDIGITNPNYDGLVSIHPNIPDGGYSIKVTAKNDKSSVAYLAAWIDFNGNGVFDTHEVSSVVTIPANTPAGSVFELTWDALPAVTRSQLETYLRVRLSSEQLDGTWAAGVSADGEVEDYKITLDLLELVKTAVSDNIVPSTADIGDTITYTIHLINKITGDIELFDPIPLYTKYIDSDPAATLANIDFYGQTVEALQWDLTNLQADENPQFTFRVVVTGRPAETDSIINIAYAVMNGDTLASAAANCHLAPVEVNRLWADYDYYAVWKNDSIMSAHISVNDTDPYRNFTRDSILTVEHGTAQLNEPRDGTLKYNSLTGFTGLDSLDYRLKALNDSVDSRAFFAVVAPYSNEYYACPGARVELGVFPDYTDTRITYEWYKNLTDVTPFANYPAPHITMGQNDTTFYLQVIINSTPAKNRLPLTVLLSDNCGTTDPAGCAVDGTLLFKEDFGGNSPNHPRVSTNPLNAGNLDEVYMQFQTSNENVDLNPAFFNYWILKTNKNQVGKSLADMGSSQEYWHTGFSDFTHPNDTTRGYMLMMDLHDNDADQIYETDLNGLCPGNQLYFSLRAVNLLIKGLPENNPYDAGIKMLVMDEHDNILASYNSGDIPRDNKGDLTWRLYGFAFTVPDNVSNIKFKIYDGPSGASEGNDFAIDDIEIRLCTPKIEFDGWDADTTVCVSSLFELSAEYNDGGYFGNDLLYRWEYSPSGDVNNPAEWSVIAASQGATNNGSVTLPQAAYTINKIKPADAGFYRFIVGNAGSIDNYLCRAMSPVIELAVLDYPEQYPDVRLQACAGVGNINLSAYIDTTGFENLQWYRESPVGPLPGTYNGVINTNEMVYPNTYVYKYDIENSCFTAQAKVFVKTLHEQSILLPPDSVVICYENAQNISLNQLFGLETGGIFTADADVMKYITRCAAPSLFEGAHVFNGKEAYLNLSGYNYTYKGDTAAKKITITYLITDTDSCLYGNGSNTYSVDIILTSVIGI